MNHRSLRRTLLVAAAVAAASAVPALAQFRIDNGQARDANNRIGSNGFNGGNGGTSPGGLNGNLVVTGNVGGGRSFRGALGYTDASAFRGNLGSASFDNFNRDSVGIGQIRGTSVATYANQGPTTFQPFFGAGRTVAPPTGFVQSIANGGYVAPRPQFAVANDGRIDYGGATRQQVARGALLDQTVIGGAGLSNGALSGFDQRQQLLQPLSEYTQLGRPSARIGLLEQNRNVFGTGLDNGVISAPRDPNAPGNGGPVSTDRQASDAAADNRAGLNPAAGTGSPNDPVRPGTTPAPADATKTGAGVQIRDLRAIQNNPQYAALRSRLDAKRPAGPGEEAIEASNRRNQQVLAQRAKQAAPADAKNGDDKKSADAKATPDASTPNVGGASGNGTTPQLDTTPAPSASDGLRLPRPTAMPDVAPAAKPAAPSGPVEIKSLAAGVKDDGLRKTLGDAEVLMKAGKFTSAIDAYDRAQSVATDDPLVFTGRAIAELGGGYYREAEKHFRQAFGADRSLLQARFDLRELLTADRLNFLVDDLGKVANADKSDPGPLVLLAIVYYNTNLPDRAAKALDLADQRAGGKDATAKLLRENWTLTPDANK